MNSYRELSEAIIPLSNALGENEDGWMVIVPDERVGITQHEIWRGDTTTVAIIPEQPGGNEKEIADYIALAQPRVVATLGALAHGLSDALKEKDEQLYALVTLVAHYKFSSDDLSDLSAKLEEYERVYGTVDESWTMDENYLNNPSEESQQ